MEWIKSARASQYTSPRTVLGFFAALIFIAVFGGAAIIAALDGDYVGQVISFIAFFVLLIAGVVIVAMFKAPMALQLGEVKGSEFIEHQRHTRGDNLSPEYTLAELGEPAPLEIGPAANEQGDLE